MAARSAAAARGRGRRAGALGRRCPRARGLAVAAAAATAVQPSLAGPEKYRESSDCWTYGGADTLNPGFGPKLCCRPEPCGLTPCWSPPEFTYHFCCEEPACSPSVVGDLQRALGSAVAELPSENASQVAFKAAPEAFRAMLRRGLRGLRLTMVGGLQACTCAIAYAVAVLLDPGFGKSVGRLLTARWLTHGFNWSQAVTEGWGPLFGWLAQTNLEDDDRLHGADAVALGGRSWRLAQAVNLAQSRAQTAIARQEEDDDGEEGFHALTASLRASGLLSGLWRRISQDTEARRAGRRCVAVRTPKGFGSWTKCTSWGYHAEADFSSPKPGAGARQDASVAVCVLGAPRNVLETYSQIRENVINVLKADAFAYVPFAGILSPKLEVQLTKLGPIVTAIAAPDVDRDAMQARIIGDFYDPRLNSLYMQAPGPWRAPLYTQMGSSMWGYFAQHICKKMVEAYEEQRGRLYDWVVFARADLLWVTKHPPLDVLTPGYVHVPFGQDNSYYNHGPEPGLNDRHAVIPRAYMQGYLGRWEDLRSGEAWDYMQKVAEAQHQVNTEQYLLLHLRARGVPVRRFPPVAFVTQCAEGPQCQHLYKGTNLAEQPWMSSAKYWSEVVEVRRTVHDEEINADRARAGWTWARMRPHAPLAPGVEQPWEIWSVDYVCGLSRNGPVSSYRWYFFRRCQCLA